MIKISKWIETFWNIPPDIQSKLLYSIIVFSALWLIRLFVLKLVFRQTLDVKERHRWRNGVKNTYTALLIIIIGAIWVDKFGSLVTFFGLLSAGLAIALQDPIVNLAGWLFIVTKKPFEVGERIQIGEFKGDVIDIRFYQFTINEINNWVDADQSTGRIIHVPNGKVFKEAQANYTQGFSHIWNEIPVLITFESDWKLAKNLLDDIANSHSELISKSAKKKLLDASKKFMIYYSNLTPVVYTSVKESGVLLTIRYLCLPKNRRGTEHKIWETILEEFAKQESINLAYPTQRIMIDK